MNSNQCRHTRPDGTQCQAHPQTGRSYCFFHDPKQQKKRTAAQRNGGFMRRRSQPEPEPNPLAALNLDVLSLQTPDDVVRCLEETNNLVRQGKMDLRAANVILALCSLQLRALKARREDARDAQQKADDAAQAVRRDIAGYNAEAGGPSSSSGKKPRYTSVVPVFTSILTGKPINFDEPSPLDPPAHLLRQPYSCSTVPGTAPFGNPKPEAPKPPAEPTPAPTEAETGNETKAEKPVGSEAEPPVETKAETVPVRNPNPYTINSLNPYDTTRNDPTRAEPKSPRDPSQWVLHPAYKIMKGIK